MGAKYSYRVWEQFAHEANTILRTFKNHPESRSVYIFSKWSDLGPCFINWGGLLTELLAIQSSGHLFFDRNFGSLRISDFLQNSYIVKATLDQWPRILPHLLGPVSKTFQKCKTLVPRILRQARFFRQ
jgi:hypothetical protein